MPTLPRQLWWLAFHVDARIDVALRRARRALGLARPLRVLPYRGYGTPARACVKARVQEARAIAPSADRQTLRAAALASYKRYATVEIPGATVRIRWADRAWEARTDDEGFLDEWVEPPPGTSPGWHQVQLEVLSPDDVRPLPTTLAPVLVVAPHAMHGVISDIDDTVIVTGVTSRLKRAYALFLTEHRTRIPFEGVGELYRALHLGPDGAGQNPLFYVSSSPWNLYEHLDAFMGVHDIPAGPILLRDWGLSRTGFAPGGGHGHKLAKIREVLESFPDLPFVLIGDSGQEDAEHYLTIAREQGGERIPVIYIRTAHTKPGRAAQLERIALAVRAAGSEMIVVDDTVEAARDAVRRGLILPEEVGLVEQRQHQDEQDPEPMEDLVGGE